jgi:predicted amidohydrolase
MRSNDIRSETGLRKIYVIAGMPAFIGDARYNCAVVIGDDRSVKTRYAQLAATGADLFQAGRSANKPSDPFRQGRVVQPALYVTMVARRLKEAVSAKTRVVQFGFFFPGARERGR